MSEGGWGRVEVAIVMLDGRRGIMHCFVCAGDVTRKMGVTIATRKIVSHYRSIVDFLSVDLFYISYQQPFKCRCEIMAMIFVFDTKFLKQVSQNSQPCREKCLFALKNCELVNFASFRIGLFVELSLLFSW